MAYEYNINYCGPFHTHASESYLQTLYIHYLFSSLLSTFLKFTIVYSPILSHSLYQSLSHLLYQSLYQSLYHSLCHSLYHPFCHSYTYGYSSSRVESEESMPLFRLKLGVAPTSNGISCARNAGNVPCYIILYCAVLYDTVLCYSIWYVLYCALLYCTGLYTTS